MNMLLQMFEISFINAFLPLEVCSDIPPKVFQQFLQKFLYANVTKKRSKIIYKKFFGAIS